MLFACLSHVAAVELPRVMILGERSATATCPDLHAARLDARLHAS
jgi:hypothetical protein